MSQEKEVQLQDLKKRRKTWLQGKCFRKERSQAYAELRVDLPWSSEVVRAQEVKQTRPKDKSVPASFRFPIQSSPFLNEERE
ncbi:hypothetical protein HAX54_022394 [Datura stramonium]|uniref:Uncharacterized protein n=1 Tax=Datura stramonium TaxID=4076 RepID=A0ABS8UWK4_DATST|nr:hypothetical protein [Datura stramonium]